MSAERDQLYVLLNAIAESLRNQVVIMHALASLVAEPTQLGPRTDLRGRVALTIGLLDEVIDPTLKEIDSALRPRAHPQPGSVGGARPFGPPITRRD